MLASLTSPSHKFEAKLRHHIPEFSWEGVKKALFTAFPQESFIDLGPLQGGMSAKVFYLQAPNKQYVLRLIPKRKDLYECSREVFYSHFMSKAGLGPQLYYGDEHDGIIIMAHIAAKPYKGRLDSFYGQLAKLAKNLHQQQAVGPYSCNMIARIALVKESLAFALPKEVGALLESLQAVEEVLKARPLPSSVLAHHDLNPNNVLWDGKRLWLIDWELTGRGDPFYDIATLLIFFTLDDKEQKAFLYHYFRLLPQANEAARILLAKFICLLFYGLILQKIAQHPQFLDFSKLMPGLPSLRAYFKQASRWPNFDVKASISTYGMLMLKEAWELHSSDEFRKALRSLHPPYSHS